MKINKDILKFNLPFDKETEKELYLSYVENYVLENMDSIELDCYFNVIKGRLSINCNFENIKEIFDVKCEDDGYFEFIDNKIYVTPKGQILIIEKLRKELQNKKVRNPVKQV